MAVPDARKSLDVLANEWESCTKCDLGVRRHETNGRLVFGGGVAGGLMIVGDGPWIKEEREGRPFTGPDGKFLRRLLEKLKVKDVYMTDAVACRSCAPVFDSLGRPVMSYGDKQRINDEVPNPVQVEACRDRLQEQIYIIDPILIIALGPAAALALTNKSVSLTKGRGTFVEIEIPGVWSTPVLTEKKKQWIRKVNGQLVAPTVQNQVRYLAMLTTHPSFALRYVKDFRTKNNFTVFWQDIQKAVYTYNRYLYELTGNQQENVELDPDEVEQYAAES